MAVLTINQYIDTINSFITNVKNTQNSYYLFLGKTNAWVDENGDDDDTNVPVADTSIYSYEQSIYKDIVFGKLITENDIMHMIPRHDWQSGTVYDPYDQNDADLYSKQFYVVTDAYEVYKCIYNNEGGESTVKPSLTNTVGTFSTADGYVWKYMYTVESNANTKFSSAFYLPVTPNTSVEENSINGSIDYIKVISGGNNYQSYHSGYISNYQNNYVIQIANTASPINRRYVGSSIYLKTGFGSGQIRKIVDYSGLNRLVTVNDPFEASMVLNVTNYTGDFNLGSLVSQRIEYLSFLYQKGYFNVGDQVIQSDTGATGNVISANVTQLRLIKSTLEDFVPDLPIYNTVQSHELKTGTADITTNKLRTVTITKAGSGYIANSTVVVSNAVNDFTGAGATANAYANSSGKIEVINITNMGAAYTLNPTITIAAPPAITFNAYTDVDEINDFITLGANSVFFANDDIVKYTVASGNTVLTNLVSGGSYYLVSANSTGFKLSSEQQGAPINLTKGVGESGHSFRGETATANSSILTYLITANSGTPFSSFSAGDLIRIGDDPNKNIRYITSTNSTVTTINYPFQSNAIANSVYKVNSGALATYVTITQANGVISDVNLNSYTLTYGNSSINGVLFTVGERVDMVGGDNVIQGANGIVSYCNSSVVILSDVQGEFATDSNNFIRGVSSLQKSNILSKISYPNITVKYTQGSFLSGEKVFIKLLPDLENVGNADLIASYRIPNELTEYIISPTVTITGDGTDALAYATVNSTFLSANEINSVVILNPGKNYTYANISISSNTLFGDSAVVAPIISPLSGHGSNAYKELGARYAGISITIDKGENENYKFPNYGSFRKVGIIENPLYEEVHAHVADYDRANLTISNKSGSGFQEGEFIIQPSTNAAGIVVTANSTYIQIKNKRGELVNFTENDDIFGLTSETTANVTVANTVKFVASDVSIVSETLSNAYAYIVEADQYADVLKLGSVSGRFDVNDTVYDPLTNAYANVTAIYSTNNTIDVSYSFGRKFSQTARVTFTSNTGFFQVGETVIQDTTLASGVVFNTDKEFDLFVNNANGLFNVGNEITNDDSGGTAVVIFANNDNGYLRLTGKTGSFSSGNRIINNVNIGADIDIIYPAIVFTDVKGESKFEEGNYVFRGQTSGAFGKDVLTSSIIYPELIRDSGSVIYIENIAPITRSITSKEKINLIIKF